MQDKLNQLKSIANEIMDLEHIALLLEWEQQTYMPDGSAEDRSHLLSTVARLHHKRYTSDELARLLEDLQPLADQLDPDSDDARLIKVTARKHNKLVKVPSEMAAEFARLTTVAQQVWEEARAENDFAHFQPHLERIVENRRQFAALFAPYDHVYDPLLDEYEPGMKTAEVKAIFDALRPQQVELIRQITDRPQVDDSFLNKPYDESKQWDFGVEVITRFGYDWEHARQDKSAHPFTSNFGINDVRITTRFLPDFFNSAFFSTAHECGHALYDLGFDQALARTPLADGASYAIHESQSRMWENLVGRSYPFWQYYYPRLQEYFPAQLRDVGLDTFYKGINKVEPSLIRVEADEATYNLHIMMRLELEIAIMEGSLEVRDLPEAWSARTQEYLGLTPPNDALGVLQDIHWAAGYFGYFSTYALGNLVALQLWERINVDIPDLDDQFRRGEFSALLSWLREHIHRHGAKFEAQELVQRVTASKIDPAAYVRYLNTKYADIYGL